MEWRYEILLNCLGGSRPPSVFFDSESASDITRLAGGVASWALLFPPFFLLHWLLMATYRLALWQTSITTHLSVLLRMIVFIKMEMLLRERLWDRTRLVPHVHKIGGNIYLEKLREICRNSSTCLFHVWRLKMMNNHQGNFSVPSHESSLNF